MKKLGQLFGISLLAAAGSFALLAPSATLHASTHTQSALTSVMAGDEAAEPSAANFKGKIVSLNGARFILRDEENATWYHLDDQKTAAAFAGKEVIVIGVLEARSGMIRVRSIHESA